MRRRRLTMRGSKRLFRRTHNKTRKLNNMLSSRGGIRL